MDAIRYAISHIKQRIPSAILERAFIPHVSNWRRPADLNVDSQINQTVIRPKVMMDCDLVGGNEILIDLAGLQAEWADARTRVYRIPKDRTQGRSIVSALSVHYYPTSNVTSSSLTQAVGGSKMLDRADASGLVSAAGSLMASADRLPIVSSATTRLVGENVIMINDVYAVGRDYAIRVVVANEENLNNINIRSYLDFAKLVEYAVKAYIYNSLIIQIGQAELQGGMELGIFKSIVEGYSDAAQNYDDFLRDVWQAVAFMNDQESWHRHIHSLVGGQR